MNRLAVANLTAAEFAPFGIIGLPAADGAPVAGGDPLDLSQGRHRFYLMRLEGRGIVFDQMARHDRVTQCLGTIDRSSWLIAVAPAAIKSLRFADLRAFSVPGDQFIMLAHGTWHAGPYFTENCRNFYNLELADTNTADYAVCRLADPVSFAL